MKLSKITLEVLKNFSNLSEYIVFNRENKGYISVSNDNFTICAFYILPESEKIINEFTSYRLDQVLKMMSVMEEDCEFVFDDAHVVLKDKRTELKIKHAAMEFLLKDGNKSIEDRISKLPNYDLFSNPDISFVITKKELQDVIKLFLTLKIEEIRFSLCENKILVSSIEITNTKSIKKIIAVNSVECKNDFGKIIYLNSLLDVSKSFDYKIEIFKDLNQFVLTALVNVKDETGNIRQKEIKLKYFLRIKADGV